MGRATRGESRVTAYECAQTASGMTATAHKRPRAASGRGRSWMICRRCGDNSSHGPNQITMDTTNETSGLLAVGSISR